MKRQANGILDEQISHGAPSVPLLDLSRENQPLRQEIQVAMQRVCDSGRFVMGPDCERLEEAVAMLCGVKHAVGCASGSDALLLALMALDVGPGDEVIVPSFTFFATASAVWRLGAKPVFAEIDPHTFNIDSSSVESLVTPATKAVVPVHLFGQCAEMLAINELAERHQLAVIEDAAQAIGAHYQGLPAGSLGDIGCFSFYPTKNLGGFGDGGMITTSDEALAQRVRLLRCHGMEPRYLHQTVGINSRLDTLQAAVLNVKLGHLAEWTDKRQQNAARYQHVFSSTGLDQFLRLPSAAPGCDHVWNQYTVRVPDGQRDALRLFLSATVIGTEVYYPVPLHLQECFRSLGYAEGSLPHTESAANEVLSLPIFPELTEGEQQAVVERIGQFFRQAAVHSSDDGTAFGLPASSLSNV